ncbi:MAG: PD40 domain-containing protein [Spirochaetales bacterium]|nr:PD40 domain-containing protein [Spirochaetales bacterium]
MAKMKKAAFVIGISVILLILIVTMIGVTDESSDEASILKNGSFEKESFSRPAGWIIENADKGTFFFDRQNKADGNQSLLITIGSQSSEGTGALTLKQKISVSDFRGKEINISGKLKAEGAELGVFIAGTGVEAEHLVKAGVSDDFTEFSYSEAIPLNTYELYMVLMTFSKPNGKLWLDDIAIEPLQQPASGSSENGNSGIVTDKINTLGWQDSPYISRDGNRLYFMYTQLNCIDMVKGNLNIKGPPRAGHHFNPGKDDSDLYVAYKQPDGHWGNITNLPFNTMYADHSGMPNKTNTVFYFARGETPEHLDDDIYVVYKNKDGIWGKAKNLGSPINTRHVEDNPHISYDEKTLYFESNRPGGRGGFDIYSCELEASGKWSSPVNMGPVINTSEDESQIWMNDKGTECYFNRTNSKKGDTQIYFSRKDAKNRWMPVQHLDVGLPLVGEASFTADGNTLYFASVSPVDETITIMYAEKKKDGSWGKPKPVD